jgi:hypothetical protein
VKTPKKPAGHRPNAALTAPDVERGAAAESILELLANGPLAWMVRVGYVARGIVFVIIGSFALLAAGGLGANPQGTRDALALLFQQPFGGYFLWILAAGLLCFAGWRFLQAVLDVEGYGNGLPALLRRAVLAGSGVFYVALAAATVRITVQQRQMTEDQAAREWAAWVMAHPLGRGLIALIALGFAGFAIGLVIKAVGAPLRHRRYLPRTTPAWRDALGSYGTMTRAFVFLMIGGYLAVAAYDSNSREAVSLAGVLRAMQSQAYGGTLLAIAALGLLAFGFFEIVEAPKRRADALNLARQQKPRSPA